jgi:CheY-like chemotaxis protein
MPSPPRILIVDDDKPIRDAMRQILEAEGFEVLEAADGTAAVHGVRAAAPQLILCDMFMPGTDGLETLRILRTEFPDVPVIAMSGGGLRGELDVLKIARHLGARGVLQKPLRPGTLLQLVRETLSR